MAPRASFKEQFNQMITSPPLISLVLFVLAFVPRLLDLGRFLTADEFLWVDRSKNFLAGLTNPAYQCTTVVEKWQFAEGLACTLRTGHPGVTTMWTGSFGLILTWLARGRNQPLHDFVVGLHTNPLDPSLIAPTRFATVLITSIWVVAVYWLLRRLMGGRIALLSALLLALSPFHVALSRVIHHDALSTTFMTLAGLTAFIYWGQAEGRKWLLASGVLAGLAVLSKSPALYLLPFIALTGLWFTIARYHPEGRAALAGRLLKQTIPDGLLWFALLLLTVFALWPAMWVIPREAIETVIFIGSKYATGGHAKGNFFLGEISSDPGALFYPVTWLFRTTPLVLVGLAAALLGGLARLVPRKAAASETEVSDSGGVFFRYVPLALLFVAGYYLLMTVGEKKQDRYFLPAYPWLDILAAGGLVLLVDWLAGLVKAGRQLKAMAFAGVVAVLLLLNGYLVASTYPYYFTYFNPAVGGPQQAVNSITVGWGEGLDLAADYLNHGISPTRTRVASWYESTFAPFYYGPSISYSKEKGKVLAGNTVIFYINQIQRRFPDDILFDYIARRFYPEQIISLNGIDYVWIYPSLGIDHYLADQTFSGIASLLAWEWGTHDAPLIQGSTYPFDFYWEYLGKDPAEPFFFRLLDSQDRVWAEGTTTLTTGSSNPPVEDWREGEILLDQGQLFVPVDTPPGKYRLQAGLYTRAPAVKNGELYFALEPGDQWVTVVDAAPNSFNLPASAVPIKQPFGESLTLLGAVVPDSVARHGVIPVDLYWQINRPLPADTSLHVGLMDAAGEAQQAWFDLSLAETFDPAETTWQPGVIIRTRWQLQLLPEVPAGPHRLELVLPADNSQVLPVGTITITERGDNP